VRRYFYVIRHGHVRAGTKTRSRLPERLRAVAARGEEKEYGPRLPRTARSGGSSPQDEAVTMVTDRLSW
jgi:hypothetical protein